MYKAEPKLGTDTMLKRVRRRLKETKGRCTVRGKVRYKEIVQVGGEGSSTNAHQLVVTETLTPSISFNPAMA